MPDHHTTTIFIYSVTVIDSSMFLLYMNNSMLERHMPDHTITITGNYLFSHLFSHLFSQSQSSTFLFYMNIIICVVVFFSTAVI